MNLSNIDRILESPDDGELFSISGPRDADSRPTYRTGARRALRTETYDVYVNDESEDHYEINCAQIALPQSWNNPEEVDEESWSIYFHNGTNLEFIDSGNGDLKDAKVAMAKIITDHRNSGDTRS